MGDASHPYLEILERRTARRRETAQHHLAPHDGAPAAVVDALERAVDAQEGELTAILHDLHEHPETAFREHHAADVVVGHLASHGIAAQRPAHGLDTAVRAEVRSQDFDPARDRTIGILAEYDALPEIGHGCGHNVIAVAGLGAFTALADLLRADPRAFRGRVVFLGTPAEEGQAGKELMARDGAFDDLDAAVMVHSYFTDTADQAWLGRRDCRVRFTGRAAHASSHPFLGRNALDAASLAYQGIGLLRQQTPPTDRIHAVITEGGSQPNIITETAEMLLYVRSQDPETLRELSARVDQVLRGAAMMAGVEAQVRWDEAPATLPVRSNGPLTDRWVLAQRRRDRDPYPGGTVSEVLAASTDFGNVSHRVPGIHPLIRVSPDGVGLHTREFAAAAGTPDAERAGMDGAFGLACTALDFLHDDALAAAVREEFEEAGGFATAQDCFRS